MELPLMECLDLQGGGGSENVTTWEKDDCACGYHDHISALSVYLWGDADAGCRGRAAGAHTCNPACTAWDWYGLYVVCPDPGDKER